MRVSFMWLISGFLVCGLVGCKSKQEQAQRKMIDLQNEYAQIIEGINSPADFQTAKPKFVELGAKMNDLAKEMHALPAMSAADQKSLDKNFEAESKQVADRIQTQIDRVAKLGISPLDLVQAMKLNPVNMGG